MADIDSVNYPDLAAYSKSLDAIPAATPISGEPGMLVNKGGTFNPTEAQAYEETQASKLSVSEGYNLSKASNQATNGLYNLLKRSIIPTDPNFKPEDHLKELDQAGIDHDLYSGFLRTNSNEEFQQYKTDLLTEQRNKQLLGAMGWKGIVGDGLASLTDPITLLTALGTDGASRFGTLGSVGLDGTRAASITRNAVLGGTANSLNASVNAAVRPTGEWSDIPAAGLQGLVLGAGIGTLVPAEATFHGKVNETFDAARKEFSDAMKSGWAGFRDSRIFDKAESIFTPDAETVKGQGFTMRDDNPFNEERPSNMEAEGSIGAAQVNPFDKSSVTSSTEKLMEDAKEYMRTTDWVNKTEFRDTPAGNAAKQFYDVLKKTPFAADWDKLANSDSTIAQALAHKLFESPSGIVRNNRSAAMLKDYYENNLLDVNRAYQTHYADYAKEQGKTFTDLDYHFKVPDQFDRDVMTEMNSRYHDNQSAPTSSKSVKNMADTLDHYSNKALEYMKGKDGETPVAGSEMLEHQSGWFRQIWRGDKMRDVIKQYPSAEKNIAQGIANSYQRIYNFTPEDSLLYAKAVVRRSLAKEDGIGTNLLNILQGDGREYFEKFLSDNGYPQEKIEPLIQTLLNKSAGRSQEGFTKQRLDVDLREQIPGTDKTIGDLTDHDIRKVWSKYSRQVSGAAALARHGIQRADKGHILNALKHELAAKGDGSIPKDLQEHLFSAFEGGPTGGGRSRATVMATRLSDLALLNSLGLTKLSEVGATIGAVGIKAFMETAPAEIRAIFKGEKTPIINDLEKFTGPVGDTETLHNDAFTFEEMKKDASVPNELLRYTEQMIGKGKRLQGFISGFYHVHTLQQRMAVTSMIQRLGELMKANPTSAEARRMYDIGLTPEVAERVRQNFQDHAEYENGKLTNLNLDKWKPSDREDFRLALNRHTYQVLQRSMAGESSMWWHSDFGSLFTHLKQFTLGSIQKQVMRNMALADPQAMASVTYGLMTAAAAYSAQKVVHGQTDKLEPQEIMKGAIELSNFTTFIPSMADPVMSILGMDNYKFNHYGQTDISTGIIPTPVVVPSLNRLLHIPGALYGLASGNYTKNDVHALQALPLIGNAPGIGAIWNAMYTKPPRKGHHKE